LTDGARTATAFAGGLRVRKILVATELALASVLLIGAALMVKSLWRITAQPPGFAPEHVLTMKVQFAGPRYSEVQPRRAYLNELLRRVQSAPGVEAAGVSSTGDDRMPLIVDGAPTLPTDRPQIVSLRITSADYATAIGMRLVKGRWFAATQSSPVCAINETLARRNFAGQDPIGRRILLPGSDLGVRRFAPIVGVMADLRDSNLETRSEPELFTADGIGGAIRDEPGGSDGGRPNGGHSGDPDPAHRHRQITGAFRYETPRRCAERLDRTASL
jgi:putative ABC transport system permease protein